MRYFTVYYSKTVSNFGFFFVKDQPLDLDYDLSTLGSLTLIVFSHYISDEIKAYYDLSTLESLTLIFIDF